MKKLIFIFFIFHLTLLSAQKKAYGDGEWLKFRVHYGLITAGSATLEVDEKVINGKQVFHVKGFGETSGVTSWFFPVKDDYQSFIDINNDKPYRFIRKIDEGGHTKDIQIDFDHTTLKATINDKKNNKINVLDFPENAQDMVSSFFYLRNNLNVDELEDGDEVLMDMFFDRENYKFKLKFLGRELLNTDFGKVACLIFRPYVQSGRVFKEQESLTLWVSDDENKIPLLIKADLMVGSLKATLTHFKGLQHSFKIIVN